MDPIQKDHTHWGIEENSERKGKGFLYLPSTKVQCNSGLKKELRIKARCIFKTIRTILLQSIDFL